MILARSCMTTSPISDVYTLALSTYVLTRIHNRNPTIGQFLPHLLDAAIKTNIDTPGKNICCHLLTDNQSVLFVLCKDRSFNRLLLSANTALSSSGSHTNMGHWSINSGQVMCGQDIDLYVCMILFLVSILSDSGFKKCRKNRLRFGKLHYDAWAIIHPVVHTMPHTPPGVDLCYRFSSNSGNCRGGEALGESWGPGTLERVLPLPSSTRSGRGDHFLRLAGPDRLVGH